MSKIANEQGETITEYVDAYIVYSVIDFLKSDGCICEEYDSLSELVKTMTGDAATSFNTIGELIQYMPKVVNCGEECHFLNINDYDSDKWFILGWNQEDNKELANEILQAFYPTYKAID